MLTPLKRQIVALLPKLLEFITVRLEGVVVVVVAVVVVAVVAAAVVAVVVVVVGIVAAVVVVVAAVVGVVVIVIVVVVAAVVAVVVVAAVVVVVVVVIVVVLKRFPIFPSTDNCTVRTASGECCIFPFTYKDKVYNNCTTVDNLEPWCAVRLRFNDETNWWGKCQSKSHSFGAVKLFHVLSFFSANPLSIPHLTREISFF